MRIPTFVSRVRASLSRSAVRYALLLLFLHLLLYKTSADAQVTDGRLAPSDFRIVLNANKKEYLVGEDVIIQFIVENTGKKPFTVQFGGDYRGAARHRRFRAKAVAADGTVAEDPFPSSFSLGGLSSWSPIGPGEKFSKDVELMRYVRIDKSGAYTITISHDLGWEPDKGNILPPLNAIAEPMPSGSLELVFRLPTTSEARALFERMAAAPKDEQRFYVFAHEVYLPVLADIIKHGLLQNSAADTLHAIDALNNLPSPEATKLLIDALAAQDQKMALEAALTLNLRLPDPQWSGVLAKSIFKDSQDERRQRLNKAAWKPEFSGPVRAVARRWLREAEDQRVPAAAFMLECLGEEEDVKPLVAALDRALIASRTLPLEKYVYRRPRGFVAVLMRAATAVVHRLKLAPPTPRTAGEAALYLVAFQTRPDFRPTNWRETFAAFLKHDVPYIREVAMKALPKPPDSQLLPLLPPLLMDADVHVRIAAAEYASEAIDESFKGPILNLLKRAADGWELRAGMSAANQQGLYVDALHILAARLDESFEETDGLFDGRPEVFRLLLGCISIKHEFQQGGLNTPAEGAKIKPHWQELLTTHESFLRSGGRFQIGGPELTPELFPKDFHFSLQNGEKWPAG